MQIHTIPSIKGRRHKRIGRSGKRGSYSGRGVKGQKSRSGRRLRPAERDLILRIPKKRGFANLTKSDRTLIFNLGEVSAALKSFVDGKNPLELNKDVLKASGLLRKGYQGEVKLLGNGDITIALTLKGITASLGAKAKIEKAGGSVG